MPTIAKHDEELPATDIWAGSAEPMTAPEAAVLRRTLWQWSPLKVVGYQAVAGMLVVLLVVTCTGDAAKALSTMSGVFCVVLPGLVFAFGMRRRGRLSMAGAVISVFFVWELIKVALTIGLLSVVPFVFVGVEWFYLLAGFVVTVKASWLALIPRRSLVERRLG